MPKTHENVNSGVNMTSLLEMLTTPRLKQLLIFAVYIYLRPMPAHFNSFLSRYTICYSISVRHLNQVHISKNYTGVGKYTRSIS